MIKILLKRLAIVYGTVITLDLVFKLIDYLDGNGSDDLREFIRKNI